MIGAQETRGTPSGPSANAHRDPEREQRSKGAKRIPEEIRARNFLHLREKHESIQEAQRTSI